METKLIGENIKTLRDGMGLNQTEIAKFLGVDQSLISKIEKGDRNLSADSLEKLACLFGVSVDALATRRLEASGFSFAFRANELETADLEAVCAINQIALNAEFMEKLLKEENL